MLLRTLSALFLSVLLVVSACRTERNYIHDSHARLEFNLDTVYFDTVFTETGTVTKSFRIKNPHKQFIEISELSLAGGEQSVFRINVDGRPGTKFEGLEIAPGDSMFVFVEATLDLNNSPDIMRIQDSVVFLTNGNVQDIDLVAWGQDVHLLFREHISSATHTWTADKPYLIIDYLYVDSLSTLKMEPGVHVHLHRDALIYVEGSLQVDGSLEEPVVFEGDRLEAFYENAPGQWGFIYLAGQSRNNRVTHSRVLNGTMGFLISASPESGLMPDLDLSNTLINQMSSHGIYALNARIDARNLVVGDCGGSSLGLVYGGNYRFRHCTFANYWNSFYSNRQSPAVALTDYFVSNNADGDPILHHGGQFERAEFLNSVICGNARMELVIDSHTGQQLEYRFDHCLTYINTDSMDYEDDPLFSHILNNQNPRFDSLPWFGPDTLSPLIDAGLGAYAVGVAFDLEGKNRLADEAPDLGAVEWVEGER